jgi:hypothetical protein
MDLSCGLQFNSSGQAYPAAGTAATIFPENTPPVLPSVAPWTPAILEVKRAVEAPCGVTFNSVLVNRYRTGQDSVSWHADDEPEFGRNPVIASVSLGGTRVFQLKHKTRKGLKAAAGPLGRAAARRGVAGAPARVAGDRRDPRRRRHAGGFPQPPAAGPAPRPGAAVVWVKLRWPR